MYWLERYLRDGDAYIGLSPGLDNRLAKIAWLHECMRLLAPNGRPLVKVHVFGTSSPAIAALHPFFSLDASTWFQGPGHGNILVPNAAIETDWVTTPITDGMRYSKRHFDHLLSAEQAWIRAHIKSLELEMSQVRYDVEARKVVSIIGYQNLPPQSSGHCGNRFPDGSMLAVMQSDNPVALHIQGLLRGNSSHYRIATSAAASPQ
jgi:hypothetical protein